MTTLNDMRDLEKPYTLKDNFITEIILIKRYEPLRNIFWGGNNQSRLSMNEAAV